MFSMTRLPLPLLLLALALPIGQLAVAQTMLPPGASQFSPPPPAPPPPPRIEVPKVPQFDAPPSRDDRPAPRPSFGERISKCLDEAAAAGMTPGERATYSRNCANR